jgi:flagellar biosynthesis protein FliQ
MDPRDIIDLGRDAVWTGLLLSAPLLLTGMIVGLAVGLLQALTQIQEQTVAFVPKFVAMLLVMSLTLPWLIGKMVEYSSEVISGIPGKF